MIFHPVKDGKDEGNLEVKTHPDGKAVIDVIPTGSAVRIQVLADGFATYAEDYQINEASREITIAMIRPQAQISTYVDNEGKPAQMQPGVQEPIRPKTATPAAPPSLAALPTARPPASPQNCTASDARSADTAGSSTPLTSACRQDRAGNRRRPKRIGRAIALRLAAAGANVAITYRGSQAEAEGDGARAGGVRRRCVRRAHRPR